MSYEDNSKHFTGRSAAACQSQHDRITKTSRVNWPWTSSEEQFLFSLGKAGCPRGKIRDEFPERTRGAMESKWREMSVPADDGVVREWTKVEDEQLQDSHREGKQWMTVGQGLEGAPRASVLLDIWRYMALYHTPALRAR